MTAEQQTTPPKQQQQHKNHHHHHRHQFVILALLVVLALVTLHSYSSTTNAVLQNPRTAAVACETSRSSSSAVAGVAGVNGTTIVNNLVVDNNNNNPRTQLPNRFAEAVVMATLLQTTGAYMQWHCPVEQQLGDRPTDHVASAVGTPCEAWQNRDLLPILWHTLDTSMVGLEWSTGSGTAWLLRRGVTMHSIEHCQPWIQDITQKLEAITTAAAHKTSTTAKWYPHHVPRSDGKGCDQSLDNHWPTMERIFGDYARYPRQHLMKQYAPAGFDLVEVDGRFRDGCIVEAAALFDTKNDKQQQPPPPMLLKADYGLLLLDNAERDIYTKANQLPSHWLVVSFVNEIQETALWMACPTVDDPYCTAARRKIVQAMAAVPSNKVGRWYKSHMARAKKDGVPEA